MFEVLEHQDDLQSAVHRGTVLHIFLGEQIDDWRQARRLVRTVAENYRLPYYTLTPTFSICPVHGYIAGEHAYCPYEHTEEELALYGRPVPAAEGHTQEVPVRAPEPRPQAVEKELRGRRGAR